MVNAAKSTSYEFLGSKPTGRIRKFSVTVHATMTLDESVIAQGVADDGYIMTNPTEDEVLRHIAFNLVSNGLLLSQIDGYANCPDDSARVEDQDAEIDFEIQLGKPRPLAMGREPPAATPKRSRAKKGVRRG